MASARRASIGSRLVGAVARVFRADALSDPLVARGPGPRVARWLGNMAGPNAVQDYNLVQMRARSREEVRKNGLADAGIEVLVSNIVGSGIKPQFTTKNAKFNRDLAQLFLEWTDESDAEGRLDFYGQQAAAVRSMAEGGDVFGRLRVRRPTDMQTVPLQIQLLEAEYVPDTKNTPGVLPAEGRQGINPIRSGVEFNLIGQRSAYHMTREHPFDRILLGATSNYDTVPVPASEVVHLAAIRRPGQIRGEPWLARAIAKLHDLDEYDDAQLVRQKISSMFAGFSRRQLNDDGDEGKVFADETDPDAGGLAFAEVQPGTIQELGDGEDITWSNPPSPGDSYEQFVREQKRGVAVSTGVMYEQLSGDYSQVNDRTFRASVNEFRRRCAMWQHHLVVYQFCRPILRRWIELGVLSGKIKLPRGVTIEDAARAKWQPEGWAYINPVQDVQAKVAEIRGGLRSRSATVSAAGEDVEQIDAEQASDNERADKLGLIHDSDPRKTSGAGGAQPDEAEATPEPASTPGT